jgi:membrane protease YdiL (CAAX protease family)
MLRFWRRLPVLLRALLAGAAVASAGTLPWAFLSLANQRYLVAVPWAVPVMAIYLWMLWRWLRGDGAPKSTAADRRTSLRANATSPDLFIMTVFAGMLGFVALIPFTILLGRLVTLNQARPIRLPEGMPSITAFALIVMASIVAGVVEEAAFRGYMQGPIERRMGPAIAILLAGALFGLAHFTHHPSAAVLAMLPFYVFVSAVYGMMAYASNSILPGIVLHAGGDVLSISRTWMTGKGEWELTSAPPSLIWDTGPDAAFWGALAAFILLGAVAVTAFVALASSSKTERLASAS